MTTFDEIMESFLLNCKVSRNLIPTNTEVLYGWIINATMYYNNKMKPYSEDFQYPLVADIDMEQLNYKLENNELLIFVNILKLIFLKNEKTSFVSKYYGFQKEFGVNNYNAQANAKDLEVKEQEEEISNLIINALDEWSVY